MDVFLYTLQFLVTDGLLTCEASWSDRMRTDFSWLESGKPLDMLYSIKTKIWDGLESLILEVKEVKPQP